MSNEKKELKNNELPEGVTELSMEDLEQVTGGASGNIGPGSHGPVFIGADQAGDGYWLGYKNELGSDKNPSEIR